ncbi:MAG: IS110 family transposase [Synergistaceae bacterium]|nr:IS110 family transposase [Synergistaceae bacterium]
MIYVGIDVAKDKHDCCILGEDGSCRRKIFSFSNDSAGFAKLIAALEDCSGGSLETTTVKAGLEATGHYSENLVAFLRKKGLEPVVCNPLAVKRQRLSHSLRNTKTDKTDAKCIAALLMSMHSNPAPQSYQISELKSLTRHRMQGKRIKNC